MSEKEYIIFCDESEKKGKYYSNFYGGVIVGSSHYERENFGDVRSQSALRRDGSMACFFVRDIELIL